LGIILGSGLGSLADEVDGVSIPYSDLPGFPAGGVSGHAKALHIGLLGTRRVAVFAGRAHYYEQGDAGAMRVPLETLQALGADSLIATNAAGSLVPGMPPGSLMMLTDHLNYSGLNPLIGEATDKRFVNMVDAYDSQLRTRLHDAARSEGVDLHEGVYAWYSGPSFETPSEIRALKILGADAVGMSTVPEVILARFLGLKTAAISTITNMAAGMSAEVLSHEHTKAMAPLGAEKLKRVIKALLA
jgi:purine-nucleoside phosphorylase